MQEQDKNAFRDMMMAAGEVYGREITKPLLQIYFSALTSSSIDQVNSALMDHMKDEKVGQYFPKPADLMRNANQAMALEAPRERANRKHVCEVSISALQMRAKVKSGDYSCGSAYDAALRLEIAIADSSGVKVINGWR